MPRRAQVRYDKRLGAWTVRTHTQRIILAKGPDDAPTGPTYTQAIKKYGEILEASRLDTEGDQVSFRALADAFMIAYEKKAEQHKLTKAKTEGKKRTLSAYKGYLKSAVEAFGDIVIVNLLPRHIQNWIDNNTSWNGSTQWSALTKLIAVLKWGVKQKYITKNPIDRSSIEIIGKQSRTEINLISSELADLIEKNTPNPQFLLLIKVLRATGCRVEEVSWAECKNWNPAISAIVYSHNVRQGEWKHKQARKGQKKDRIIFLPPELADEVNKLVEQYKTGFIFRTPRGKKWKTTNIGNMWRATLDSKEVKQHCKDNNINSRGQVTPYSYRHTFITDWVLSGRSVKILADLLGTSVAMIEQNYSHTNSDPISMRNYYMNFMTGGKT